MSQLEEEDLITLEDNSRYLILDRVEYENKNYLFIIGVTKDDDIDFKDILFVEETEENGEYYLEAMEDADTYKKLITICLTRECVENIPGLKEELEQDSN